MDKSFSSYYTPFQLPAKKQKNKTKTKNQNQKQKQEHP